MALVPGGLYAGGVAALDFGVPDLRPPYVLKVFASRNGTDDPSLVLRAALAEPGRWNVTGTIPAAWAAGDLVVVWARLTAGGETSVQRVDQFTVVAAP